MLEIRNLTQYILKKTGENRTKFIYVIGDGGFTDEMDVPGHVTLEEALSLVKEMMTDRLIKISLKETVSKIDANDEEYELMGLDLRNMIFDIDIFDMDSELYLSFKRLILKFWSDEFPLVYHLFLNIEKIKIHDDSDGKTLFAHYFEGLREFKNQISFIEYLNSKVKLPVINDYPPYIDTDQLVDYYIIDPDVKRSELDYVLKQNNVDIRVTKENSSHWQAFGYCYAKDNDLSDLEALSFAKLFSRYVSMDPSTLAKNSYIKEAMIEEIIEKRDMEYISRNMPAEERFEKIFYELFDIYDTRIQDYEYKNRRLNFRLTSRQHDRFMKIPGKSNTEKLENLIDSYYELTNKGDIDFDGWLGDEIEIVSISKKNIVSKNKNDSNE